MSIRHKKQSVLFPETPEIWHTWPVGVEVYFTLTANFCVYGELYEEYRRNTCAAIADTVFDPVNKRTFVGYRVYADGFVPAFEWYVTWPIMRRGGEDGLKRREPMQGAFPWDWHPDNTLLEVLNQPMGKRARRQVYMLRVGGRTKADAVENWQLCVVPFRNRLRTTFAQTRAARLMSEPELELSRN